MNKKHWVTHEQLDTPLCDIFPVTKTNGTARAYVTICERLLNLKPKKLEKMSYKKMNQYMDRLEELIDKELGG